MGENELFTKNMWLIFAMVDVIPNRITYFSMKTYTYKGFGIKVHVYNH